MKFYIYLAKKGFPSRYYSELLAFDNEAEVSRADKQVGRFYAILLKRYDGSLKNLLKKLNPKEKKKIVSKLKRRVKRLHELGIVHNDLTLSNILLRRKGKGLGVLLTDFANSKFTKDERSKKKELKRLKNICSKILQV